MHRPSNNERFWLRNMLLLVGSAYVSSIIYEKYQDGSLQEMSLALLEKLQSKVYEHVFEPFTKLGQELFHTIRNREIIVEREDLQKSKEALERMLSDFSKSQQGHELILPNIREELLKKQRQLFQNGGSDGAGSATATGTDSTASTASATNFSAASSNNNLSASAALEAISPTADQALAALMKEYERELQTPIRGIIFGSLFTAILIQVKYFSALNKEYSIACSSLFDNLFYFFYLKNFLFKFFFVNQLDAKIKSTH